MSTALTTLTSNMAKRFELGETNAQELIATLKATAFKGQVSDAQLTALMVVAQQYGLNPWTKEIYAFPDKQNGIVPVVGVDGWSRIINENPQFDGIEFTQDEESCTCTIYRKDRNHPTKVTEFKAECSRNTGPWQSHPKRMLRHKSLIQCARLAFGFVGIYDPDEAERIVESKEKEINPIPTKQQEPVEVIEGVVVDQEDYPDEGFAKNKSKWCDVLLSGRKTIADIENSISTKGFKLSSKQKAEMEGWLNDAGLPL